MGATASATDQWAMTENTDTVRAALELEAAHTSRRELLEARSVPGDPLAPYRRLDGTLDVDALELGHPAPTLTRLEAPAPFTAVREGRRYVPATVREARRRAAAAAEQHPPPVPGADVNRLRCLVDAPESAPARPGGGHLVDWVLVLSAVVLAVVIGVEVAAMAF